MRGVDFESQVLKGLGRIRVCIARWTPAETFGCVFGVKYAGCRLCWARTLILMEMMEDRGTRISIGADCIVTDGEALKSGLHYKNVEVVPGFEPGFREIQL